MKYVYEFIGTFFLVTVVGMVIIEPGAAANSALHHSPSALCWP